MKNPSQEQIKNGVDFMMFMLTGKTDNEKINEAIKDMTKEEITQGRQEFWYARDEALRMR